MDGTRVSHRQHNGYLQAATVLTVGCYSIWEILFLLIVLRYDVLKLLHSQRYETDDICSVESWKQADLKRLSIRFHCSPEVTKKRIASWRWEKNHEQKSLSVEINTVNLKNSHDKWEYLLSSICLTELSSRQKTLVSLRISRWSKCMIYCG